MKVEMTIDASNIGETIVDMFQNLTTEQKESIALSVLEQWLKEPDEIHKTSLHRKAIEHARERNSWSKEKPDSYFEQTGEYKDYLRKNPTPKEAMIRKITTEVIDYHSRKIGKMIQTDPEIQAIMQQTFETIKANFPKIVNDAMIAWFCSNMQTMADGIGQALFQSSGTAKMVQQIIDNNSLRS